jgi:hypothetical protein
MKILSKVNRGLIATIIVIIAVIIYIVTVTVGQEMQKTAIKKACTDYITMDIKYKLLPTDYIDANKKVPQSTQDSIISSMTSDIKATYIDNNTLVDTVIKGYKDNLEAQFKSGANAKSMQRTILKYDSFTFNGDFVVVSFTSSVDEKDITGYTTDPSTSKKTAIQSTTPNSGQSTDSMTFQYVNSTWKVVVASLNMPQSGGQSKSYTNGVVIN